MLITLGGITDKYFVMRFQGSSEVKKTNRTQYAKCAPKQLRPHTLKWHLSAKTGPPAVKSNPANDLANIRFLIYGLFYDSGMKLINAFGIISVKVKE